MNKQSKWVSKENDDLIIENIKEIVVEFLSEKNGSEYKKQVAEVIIKEQIRLFDENESWIEDDQSEFHLYFMCLILASYNELLKVCDKNKALEVLKRAIIDSVLDQIQSGTRYALDYSDDPMQVLVEASKERENKFFGKTFFFERISDNIDKYHLHVKKCFYHKFSAHHKVPELMNILCRWDWIWADAISPSRHGFEFSLSTTLGYGNDLCRFYFDRINKNIS